MSNLDSALLERMLQIAETENRPFSHLDFVPSFDLNGHRYRIARGTFRNKVSNMIKTGKVEPYCYSSIAFYIPKGVKLENEYTIDHTGVSSNNSSLSLICTKEELRIIKNTTLYRLVQNIPYEKCALHDIRLSFKVDGIWSVLAKDYNLQIDAMNKGIRLEKQRINGLDILVTVYRTDTVTVVIGCSFAPVVVDLDGVRRLSSALQVIEEQLDSMLKVSSTADDKSSHCCISNHMTWTVTMWHFGADASVLFKGEAIHVSWKTAEAALIALYSKKWKYGKLRIRAERQEYPKKPLEEALEEKLCASDINAWFKANV